MIARTQKLLESHTFNYALDRFLFVGGALALLTSVTLAAASLLVA